MEKNLNDIIKTKEFKDMYQKMHTPWKRRYRKISPNEVCPSAVLVKSLRNVLVLKQ